MSLTGAPTSASEPKIDGATVSEKLKLTPEQAAEKFNIPGEKPSDKVKTPEDNQENFESTEYEKSMNDRILEQSQTMLKYVLGEIDRMPQNVSDHAFWFSLAHPEIYDVTKTTKPKNKELRDTLVKENKIIESLFLKKRNIGTIKYQQEAGGYGPIDRTSVRDTGISDYGEYKALAEKILK